MVLGSAALLVLLVIVLEVVFKDRSSLVLQDGGSVSSQMGYGEDIPKQDLLITVLVRIRNLLTFYVSTEN